MAYKCFICSKGNQLSKRSMHHKGVAGGQWKHKAQKRRKNFKANLHKIKVLLAKTPIKVKLCTGCLSKLKQTRHGIVGKQQLQLINYIPASAVSKSN